MKLHNCMYFVMLLVELKHSILSMSVAVVWATEVSNLALKTGPILLPSCYVVSTYLNIN